MSTLVFGFISFRRFRVRRFAIFPLRRFPLRQFFYFGTLYIVIYKYNCSIYC